MTCYAAGIPFLKGTLLGDLVYSGVLFGSFALAQTISCITIKKCLREKKNIVHDAIPLLNVTQVQYTCANAQP